MDGELLTLVPPSIVIRSGTTNLVSPNELEGPNSRYGSIACKTSGMEPGVDTGI